MSTPTCDMSSFGVQRFFVCLSTKEGEERVLTSLQMDFRTRVGNKCKAEAA